MAALRARNTELRHQVAELRAALEPTASSLKERRPNLPALRPPGAISRFQRPALSVRSRVLGTSVTRGTPSR